MKFTKKGRDRQVIEDYDYLSKTHAAQLLGVSSQTILLWADSGKLPCKRVSSGERIFELTKVAALKLTRQKGEK